MAALTVAAQLDPRLTNTTWKGWFVLMWLDRHRAPIFICTYKLIEKVLKCLPLWRDTQGVATSAQQNAHTHCDVDTSVSKIKDGVSQFPKNCCSCMFTQSPDTVIRLVICKLSGRELFCGWANSPPAYRSFQWSNVLVDLSKFLFTKLAAFYLFIYYYIQIYLFIYSKFEHFTDKQKTFRDHEKIVYGL